MCGGFGCQKQGPDVLYFLGRLNIQQEAHISAPSAGFSLDQELSTKDPCLPFAEHTQHVLGLHTVTI